MIHRTLARSRRSIVLALCGITACLGCSSDEGLQSLSGSIEFKGKSLPEGQIQFESVDQLGKPYFTGAMIQNGEYFVPKKFGLPAGSYRARINAASEAFYIPGPPGTTEKVLATKEMIPAEYNADSEQVVEVKVGNENVFDFNIE